jgi:hypothetical protein
LNAETPNVRGKTRTREHVLADLSINHVERQVLLCGFSVDRVQHDYAHTKNTIHKQLRGGGPKNV